jgi:hypothetical protein
MSTVSAAAVPTEALLAALAEAIDFCAQHEDDDLHTGTLAGRTLADLAASARDRVRALGLDGGTPLAEATGVVVVRELVAAFRLLQRVAAAGTPPTPVEVAAAA